MRRFGAVLAILVPAAVLYAQDTGYVKARGKPASAAVFIDGKYIGPASRFTVPEKYATPAGEAEGTLREPRYEDYTTKVTVTARKTAKIHYSLKKLPVPEPAASSSCNGSWRTCAPGPLPSWGRFHSAPR